jgi:glycosyltransferase involved in cell wall biosynthesis
MAALPMNILHLSTQRHLRGGERQMLSLHRELLNRGAGSVVMCREGSAVAARPCREIIQIPFAGQWDPRTVISIVRHCRTTRPSCIHCHDGNSLSAGALASALAPVPLIVTRRVVFAITDHPFNRWKYGRCCAAAAISSAVADRLKAFVPAHALHVIHDGVDLAAPLMSREQSRTALGARPDDFVVGTVGHFSPEKNFPLIVKCAEALTERFPEARIVCIGPLEPSQRRILEGRPAIIAPGHIENACGLYAAFDMYISTSRKEGLGSALLDAVVRDIPTVALDGGGTRDIYPRGSSSLVEAHDDGSGFIDRVLQTAAEYPAARQRAREEGARARDMFSIGRMTDKYIEIYRTLGR